MTVTVSVSALLLVAGCGGGGTSSNAGLLPTPDQTTTSAVRSAHSSPVGQCHRLSQQVIAGAVDHSQAVSCSRAHNAETVGVHPIYSKLTKAARDGYLRSCFNDVGSYLSLQGPELDRIYVLVVAEAGTGKHGVVRCDLEVKPGISNGGLVGTPVLTRSSLRHQERSGHTESWHWCTNARLRAPSSPVSIEESGSLRFVSCTQPHLAEAEFQPAEVTAVGDKYPTPSTLSRQGHAACRRGLVDRSDAGQLQVFGLWESKSSWVAQARPSRFGGICWFYRADGRMLPPVR